MRWGFKWNTLQVLGILPLILVVLLSSFTVIPVNTVGIKFNQFTGVSEDVLSEGLKFKTPFDTVYKISTEVQTKTVANVAGQTKDAQYITMTMDIKYRVSPVSAFEVFKQFKNLDNVNESLLAPLVQRAIEEVTTKYNVIDILGEERNNIYTQIEKVLSEKLAASGINLFSLVLVDTDAGNAIETAIEQEAVAKKAVETAKQSQEKARIESETKVIQAEAAAQVKIVEAQAEADANKLLSNSITPQILQQMEMEARLKHGWVTISGAGVLVGQ
jgi:regulator of protease activity HflC (stomatin/prohibitin superfamily)